MVVSTRGTELVEEEEWMYLPEGYLRIQGLVAFGYANFTKANAPVKDHYHPGSIEFSVMKGGSQKYIVNGASYTLTAGDVMTQFDGEIHGSGNEPQGVSEFFFVEVDLRESKGFLGLAAPWDRYLYDRVKSWNRRLVKLSGADIELLHHSFRSFSGLARDPEDRNSRLGGMSFFLAFLSRLLDTPEVRRNADMDVQRAQSYIQEHITEQLLIEQIAESLGISASSLTRKFKSRLGVSPREYINRQKVEEAQKLLLENELTLTEIAVRLGFSTSSYFASVFKQFVSCTPSEYRKKNGEIHW